MAAAPRCRRRARGGPGAAACAGRAQRSPARSHGGGASPGSSTAQVGGSRGTAGIGVSSAFTKGRAPGSRLSAPAGQRWGPAVLGRCPHEGCCDGRQRCRSSPAGCLDTPCKLQGRKARTAGFRAGCRSVLTDIQPLRSSLPRVKCPLCSVPALRPVGSR